MTFLEAAIEVLRREGRPTPVKRLAELAVKLNLLSVVGRDPEGTMQARLDDALEKEAHRLPIVRIKPGVYGLHVYPPRPAAEVAPVPANGHGEAPKAEEGGEKKSRRRRSRRGRGAKGEAVAAGGEPGEHADADDAEAEVGGVEVAGEAAAARADEAAARADEAGEPAGGVEAAGETAVAARADEAGEPSAARSDEAGESGAVVSAEGEKRKRRRSRRGGRGRRREDAETEALPAEDAGPSAEGAVVEAGVVAVGERAGEAAVAAAPKREPLPDDAFDTVPTKPDLTEEAAEAVARAEAALAGAGAGAVEAEAAHGDADADEELLDEDEFDVPAGPLMAPTGAEEGARGDEERIVRAEILGGRDRERGRRRRDRRDRESRREARPSAPAPAQAQKQAQAPSTPPAAAPAQAPAAAARSVVDGLVEILRAEGGRPMHVRQLAEHAVKRRVVDGRGGPQESLRQVRLVLQREVREREAAGLRPRVRPLGGGQWVPADRKADPELLPLERDVAERAARLREATLKAVRRRIGRLNAPSFEALGRLIVEKLSVEDLEPVRRGEGVAYFGGMRPTFVGPVRTLVSFRPGEGEITRRAVGELRAGLQAKGYDEGFLFSGGRLGQEGLTELKAGKGVTVYDGTQMAELCLLHGIGVKRLHLPVDYLDVDFFFELSEG